MRKLASQIITSASDLTNFLSCPYLTVLDKAHLQNPLEKSALDGQIKLIQEKGNAHERDYLSHLKTRGLHIIDCKGDAKDDDVLLKNTIAAFQAAPDIIYQAYLKHKGFAGFSDFLVKTNTPSALGAYSYEPLDTKLSSVEKPYFIIQLCFYAEILSHIQGVLPKYIHVVLGSMEQSTYLLSDYYAYYQSVRKQYLSSLSDPSFGEQIYPLPCSHCQMCHWKSRCESKRLADDHLCTVATIRSREISLLQECGIKTVTSLANHDSIQPKGIGQDRFQRLQLQAALQHRYVSEGVREVVVLPVTERQQHGFELLPQPEEGDLFYDIEGDPLVKELDEEGSASGLEYLHGVYFYKDGTPQFLPFWSLEKGEQERRCFENLMDFFDAHLAQFPKAKIYHYASYEVSALKRLMCQYGTREAMVDRLLREGILVDLYKIVKRSLATSEPRYSIKNLESFYMGKRTQDLKSGGASVVYFEEYLLSGDRSLLDKIEEYNRIDCESTYLLREWLLNYQQQFLNNPDYKLLPSLPIIVPTRARASENSNDSQEEKLSFAVEQERVMAQYREKLLPNGYETLPDRFYRETLFFLLDYFRREDKPSFWTYYEKLEKTEEELLEDPSCLAGLTLNTAIAPIKEKRSYVYTYCFPEQETKMRTGATYRNLYDDKSITLFSFSSDTMACQIKKTGDAPSLLTLIPNKPIDTSTLKVSLRRYADCIVEAACDTRRVNRFRAVSDILQQSLPRFRDTSLNPQMIGSSLDASFIPSLSKLIEALDHSYLIIQGPPGTGKTYTASRIICSLLQAGKRVGVTAHGHKAINNLIHAIERYADSIGFSFQGIKRSSREEPDTHSTGQRIGNCFSNEEFFDEKWQLRAGTAWAFAHEALDESLDYMFIDEAGQLSLAMGLVNTMAATNVVLIGDTMQLAAPSQGIHPGKSGQSILEFLQGDCRTVRPEQGVLLDTTYRMHGDICDFISEQIYDGRLQASPDTNNQRILTQDTQQAGILFLDCQHTGNSARSLEEVEAIHTLYNHYLGRVFVDRDGAQSVILSKDILVIAPYNMQVQALRERLGEHARVGTIDKFQGQEAPIVIVSMTTSSQNEMPRNMEFLFSRNRLNVALSRAKALSIVVASPELLKTQCRTVEQVKLVNLLCAVQQASCHK
jgi:predicted RecB family nuclease